MDKFALFTDLFNSLQARNESQGSNFGEFGRRDGSWIRLDQPPRCKGLGAGGRGGGRGRGVGRGGKREVGGGGGYRRGGGRGEGHGGGIVGGPPQVKIHSLIFNRFNNISLFNFLGKDLEKSLKSKYLIRTYKKK